MVKWSSEEPSKTKAASIGGKVSLEISCYEVFASSHRVLRLKAPYVSAQVAGSGSPTALDAERIIAESWFWSMAQNAWRTC